METFDAILDRDGCFRFDATPPEAMMRRRPASRAELVERKHRLEGEINVLRSEIRRLRTRGQNTAHVERRLAQAQRLHYETRLEIDRTAPEH